MSKDTNNSIPSDQEIDEAIIKYEMGKLGSNQLKIIYAMVNSSSATITANQLSQVTDMDKKTIGAQLSSLSKIKIDNDPIINPRGRTADGIRWKVSPRLNYSDTLKETVEDILNEK